MNEHRGLRASGWPGVVVLALGIFAMVTVEELPIGVLTLISDDLGASEGAVGLGVTLAGGVTTVDFDLNDPELALGARAKVALTSQQTVLSDALPRRFADEGVRRYGFHGISYEYVAQQLGQLDPALLGGRVIAAHLETVPACAP